MQPPIQPHFVAFTPLSCGHRNHKRFVASSCIFKYLFCTKCKLCSGVGREIAASRTTGPRDIDPTSSHISNPSPITNMRNIFKTFLTNFNICI